MPPPAAHHLLESIEITGGYLKGAHLTFSDGLNCIIGSRGSGKTTLIELLRFAVAAPLPTAAVPGHDALVRGTLGDGQVSVRVRTQHGVQYQATRSVGHPSRVTTATGEVANVSLDGELFKVEIYGQNQIESIAADGAAQLTLIDRFIEADARRLTDGLAETERLLEESGSNLLRLAREIEDDEERTRELPSIEEALKGLRHLSGPSAEIAQQAFAHKRLRARERAALSETAVQIEQLQGELGIIAKGATRHFETDVEPEIDRGPNGALFVSLASELRASTASLHDATRLVDACLTQAADRITQARHALDALHESQDTAFVAFLEQHDEDQGRVAERARLEQRHDELTLVARRLDGRRRDSAKRKAERRVLLERLFALRHERFLGRQRVCRDLSTALEGEVRVSIQEAADAAPYVALLADVLRGANLRPASFASDIARLIKPEDLAAMALENDVHRLIDIDDAKTGKSERAQRILDAIRSSGRVFEIETALLGDVPLIELRAGTVYKRSAEVSMGQRCTCILPILLLRAASPLLINQPEDNLDNAFIYDVLVKSVTLAKRTRQLVFVTHNPNIPVLGEAERVFVLTSDGDRGAVADVGNVDELRAPVERLLEGGSEAFLRRGQRYGHGTAL